MEKANEQILGALIGLSRATDGNEHLITHGTTVLIRTCLWAVHNCAADAETILNRITDEKRRMVPDCFLCASPCGRTDAFNLGLLEHEPEEIRVRKQELLHLLLENSSTVTEPLLYNTLTVIGFPDYPEALLDQMIRDLKK